jgi:bifunctional DNase/RNase
VASGTEGRLGRQEALHIDDLIEVTVDSIRVHLPTAQHVVILKEKVNDRYLPIWIGQFEANAIAMRIQGMAPERPITHDLMSTTFGELGISVSRIVVTALSEEVFFARLHLKQDGREVDIDSRPSDAIALAVRFDCPIFVAADVLDRAGVIPEKEEEEAADDKVDEDRLAVFRDLVNSLDLPDLPDEPGSRGRGSRS